jgi:DNA-binding transcriptional MerR regulator/quercetin dioxygenase-like cupin family protein
LTLTLRDAGALKKCGGRLAAARLKHMAYTVRKVAAMSGVSVRSLHFYDETGLLKPAYIGANGYRYYEQAQLLRLQQILFYRELGFELKRIKKILSQRKFEVVAALLSHRREIEKNCARMGQLLETIDKTIQHLKGTRKMKTEDMFAGFSVEAGMARFDETIKLHGKAPYDCKVSGKDNGGAMCVFESVGGAGGPQHVHGEQDEWIYVVEGEVDFVVGKKRFQMGAGGSVFVPRKVAHGFACVNGSDAKIVNVYQPAGTMEEFFREIGKFSGKPAVHEALGLDGLQALFRKHGMEIVGPPLTGEWKVEEQKILRVN